MAESTVDQAKLLLWNPVRPTHRILLFLRRFSRRLRAKNIVVQCGLIDSVKKQLLFDFTLRLIYWTKSIPVKIFPRRCHLHSLWHHHCLAAWTVRSTCQNMMLAVYASDSMEVLCSVNAMLESSRPLSFLEHTALTYRRQTTATPFYVNNWTIEIFLRNSVRYSLGSQMWSV